jgi:hypothetical protein
MADFKVSLTEQVAAVEREIKMRQRVYPRWVEGGRMTQQKADAEIRAMEAVLATVQAAEKSERLI